MSARPDLDAIAVFVKVVQAGSFTRAAEILGVPKSTASAKVSALEDRLGTALLTRTTRRLSVTEAGRAYFERCRRGLQEIENAEQEAAFSTGTPKGLLRVTAPTDAGHAILPQMVCAFLKAYPETEVECLVTNRSVDLVGEGVDLALRGGPLKDSSLVAKRARLGGSGLWASPAYLKSRGEPRRPKDLAGHECVRTTGPTGAAWSLSSGRERAIHKPVGRTQVDDFETARAFALAGAGICLAPAFLCADDAAKGRLTRVLPSWESTQVEFHFVYPSAKHASPKTKAFIEIAQRVAAEICEGS